MSVHEYWIGEKVDADAVWRDYEAGRGYEQKYYQTTCHLLEIEFEGPPVHDPDLCLRSHLQNDETLFS